MDRRSGIQVSQRKTVHETENHPLGPAEVQMIAIGRTEQLAEFASSLRLHAADLNGDTPLHIVARMGRLGLCELFVRAGADLGAQNHERQTPADVAIAEGHPQVAELLESLADVSTVNAARPALVNVAKDSIKFGEGQLTVPTVPNQSLPIEHSQDLVELDDPLTFEPEEDPEHFFDRSVGELASGTFVALVATSPAPSGESDADWEVDLSPAKIEGDGVNFEVTSNRDTGDDHDFLKVRNSGRRSAKSAAVPSGTRLSIDSDICLIWAEEILEKGWFTSEDVDLLIWFCSGNCELDDLRSNIFRTLEAADLPLCDGAKESAEALLDNRSSVTADDLAEALEATLSRAIRLPGTRRFRMDKSDEARLLDPVVQAKQELQLAVLASGPAIHNILRNIDLLFDGSVEPGFVTIKSIAPTRHGDEETALFIKAAEALRGWNAAGRVMDGKSRRNALWALETLELSLMFHKAIVNSLAENEETLETSLKLDDLIAAFETSIDRLLLGHLPYARRFAARNVEEGEDLEDVFQVAFTGLQRSTRRFDPKRGHRFVVYSTFWMKQAVTRWRADEGAMVRIPVHRHEKVSDLDRAIRRLEAKLGRFPTEAELVTELGWEKSLVQSLLRIPRRCSDLGDLKGWQGMVLIPDQQETVFRAEMSRIVAEALTELPKRQASVIRMRFGIGHNDEMTLEEIGRIYGVSRERIRQIEADGLNKLSNPRRKRRLQTLLGG